MDLIFFFRDPLVIEDYAHDESSLLKLCDMHNIPIATNLATAELLVLALGNGDLEWRE